jgi:hypothetical protein
LAVSLRGKTKTSTGYVEWKRDFKGIESQAQDALKRAWLARLQTTKRERKTFVVCSIERGALGAQKCGKICQKNGRDERGKGGAGRGVRGPQKRLFAAF